MAGPAILLVVAAVVAFLLRKRLVVVALFSLASLVTAIAIVASTPADATSELLGLPLRLSPLGRLAAMVLLAILGALVLDVWLDEPAYNFFPTALGVGAAVVAVMVLVTPLAIYTALLAGLLLPVGSFTFQIHRNRSVEAASRHYGFVTLGGTLGL
ncbi:MAG: hypothetical protein AAB114_00465, partial [Chloroflexota bacterium]